MGAFLLHHTVATRNECPAIRSLGGGTSTQDRMHVIGTLTARTADALRRRMVLTGRGYRVVTPRIPAGIVDLVRTMPCSAVVVNTTVPAETKERILEQLKREFPDIPVLQICPPGTFGKMAHVDAAVSESDPLALLSTLERLIDSADPSDETQQAV